MAPARRAAGLAPQDLLVFSAVAAVGGIRAGAQALGVPRSTVSRQLAALERALGGALVSRSTRRFVLTELGSALLVECRRVEEALAAAERVVAQVAREPAGTLRIASSQVIGEELLPPVIAAYLARWPESRVEVRLSSEFVDLRRADVDLAVRTGPLEDASDLWATRLGTSLKGHYASAAYLARRGAPDTPAALAVHDCIVIGTRAATSWSFRGRQGEVYVPVRGSLVVDSYRLALAAAVRGVGIARLPSLLAADLVAAGALLPVLERAWERTVLYAVHAAGQPAPPKIRAFVELLREGMRGRLD